MEKPFEDVLFNRHTEMWFEHTHKKVNERRAEKEMREKAFTWMKRKPPQKICNFRVFCARDKQSRLCNAIKIVWDWLRRNFSVHYIAFFLRADETLATLVLFKLPFLSSQSGSRCCRTLRRKYQKLKLINYFCGECCAIAWLLSFCLPAEWNTDSFDFNWRN